VASACGRCGLKNRACMFLTKCMGKATTGFFKKDDQSADPKNAKEP
jgi:hypothetical protein